MQEPLAQLRDIHLPDPINWWPPAPGWWDVTLLGALLLFWLSRYLLDKHQNKRYRRLALVELQQVKPDSNNLSTDNNIVFAQQLNDLLKRTALAHYPRHVIAPLSGKAWLDFLDQSSQGSEFSEGVGQALAELPYREQSDCELDCQALWILCRKWVREHQ